MTKKVGAISYRPAKQKITKESDVLKFGKYKGKTIEYILDFDPSYIVWLVEEDVANISDEIYDQAQQLDYEQDGWDDDPYKWGD